MSLLVKMRDSKSSSPDTVERHYQAQALGKKLGIIGEYNPDTNKTRYQVAKKVDAAIC